jgi:predicted enzyme related to lactoylglutathione lyase
MITSVSTICIFVEDQDRAKAFYRDMLGFEVRADNPLFPGAEQRWLAVAPAGESTEIVLYEMDGNWEHYRAAMGKSQAVTFEVDDLDETYEGLSAKGVAFASEPETQAWGRFATIIDSEGNRLLLTEVG